MLAGFAHAPWYRRFMADASLTQFGQCEVKRSQCARPIKLSLLLIIATMVAGLAIRFPPFRLHPVVVNYGGNADVIAVRST
jgi:hypothetical protein